jgi:hypothetical protein
LAKLEGYPGHSKIHALRRMVEKASSEEEMESFLVQCMLQVQLQLNHFHYYNSQLEKKRGSQAKLTYYTGRKQITYFVREELTLTWTLEPKRTGQRKRARTLTLQPN